MVKPTGASRSPSPQNIPPNRPPSRVGRAMGRIFKATGKGIMSAVRTIGRIGRRRTRSLPSLSGRASLMTQENQQEAKKHATQSIKAVNTFKKQLKMVRSPDTVRLLKICDTLLPLLKNVKKNPTFVALSNLKRPIMQLQLLQDKGEMIPYKTSMLEVLEELLNLGGSFNPSSTVQDLTGGALSAETVAGDILARGGTASVSTLGGPDSEEVVKEFRTSSQSSMDTVHLREAQGQKRADKMARLAHPNIIPINTFNYSIRVKEDSTKNSRKEAPSLEPVSIEMPRADAAPICNLRGEFLEGVKDNKKLLWSIVKQTASALKYLHSEGVVHRDIQAKNIMLDKTGHVLICDLDSAYEVGDLLARDKSVLFPPEYHASRELRDSVPITKKFDSWQFGMLLADLFLSEESGPGHRNESTTALDEGTKFMFQPEVQSQYQGNLGAFFVKEFNSQDTKLNNLLVKLLDPNPKTRLLISELKL